ncbi:hypothetical protein ACQ4M3_39515 [Leptolyngbya sp. AN03gr2]|uniref:hypothetical protein n=1 Tax=unclassified Leptolyngbya TaxID=2650499 RepID=UPI003D31A932
MHKNVTDDQAVDPVEMSRLNYEVTKAVVDGTIKIDRDLTVGLLNTIAAMNHEVFAHQNLVEELLLAIEKLAELVPPEKHFAIMSDLHQHCPQLEKWQQGKLLNDF